MKHALYALAFQLAAGVPPFLIGYKWALFSAGAAAVAFFAGREHGHQQVDIVKMTGISVEKQPPLDGFKGWDRDRIYDVVIPLAACAVVVVIGALHG